jgi:putative hydrolase of HD superfamily
MTDIINSNSESGEKFREQINFLIEIDKIKTIFRKTRLFDNSRTENDAEHSWHLCMYALTLKEYSNEPVDILKVLKMLLIHDLVEIYAGDTFLYSDKTKKQKKKEETDAAKKLFGLLPEEQGEEFLKLWEEFEEEKTAEAKFASALDRLEPVMQNCITKGATWKKHNIKKHQVIEKNNKIENGSEKLWEYASGIIDEAVLKGYLEE